MERRGFLASGCTFLCAATTGCPASGVDEPDPRIDAVELENHRRTESREFDVAIEADDDVVLEET